MAKFSPPKTASRALRTSSIRIPTAMLAKIETDMSESGFNRKQRSQWINQVVLEFLQRSDCSNLIAEEFILPGSTESIPLSITIELDEAMIKILEQVAEQELINKDKSALIRTAITQRLMAKAGMQLSPQETFQKAVKEIGEGGHESIAG